jgi:hypothetical protein
MFRSGCDGTGDSVDDSCTTCATSCAVGEYVVFVNVIHTMVFPSSLCSGFLNHCLSDQ